MSSDDSTKILLILDAMPLRRALLSRYLQEWAGEHSLKLDILDMDRLEHLRSDSCALVLVGTGSGKAVEERLLAAERVMAVLDPDIPLVVIADTPEVEAVRRAIEIGASAYIPMTLPERTFLSSLSFVYDGGCFFPPELLREIAGAQPDATPNAGLRLMVPRLRSQSSETDTGVAPLTSSTRWGTRGSAPAPPPARGRALEFTGRQAAVLECLRKAYSNKEIAREVGISEATVKVQVRQLMKKLGASNRTHVALLALQHADAGSEPSEIVRLLGGRFSGRSE